eukprot:8539195-Pyramimonas_sp.AAC.2
MKQYYLEYKRAIATVSDLGHSATDLFADEHVGVLALDASDQIRRLAHHRGDGQQPEPRHLPPPALHLCHALRRLCRRQRYTCVTPCATCATTSATLVSRLVPLVPPPAFHLCHGHFSRPVAPACHAPWRAAGGMYREVLST